MTKQETFDTVARHLLKQGRHALDPTFGCAYRDKDGLKCAVGCLIPDDRYRKSFEGELIFEADEVGALMKELGHDIALLQALQGVHDHLGVDAWRSGLGEVAVKFELSTAVMDEIEIQ